MILCVHILCSILGCYEMLGRKGRDQLELFVAGSLDQLVPEDHILVRVNRLLDLGWLREEVADCYCVDHGRPGIDPEVAVRLMLAGLLLGKSRKVSRTDPDASMATAAENRRLEPSTSSTRQSTTREAWCWTFW